MAKTPTSNKVAELYEPLTGHEQQLLAIEEAAETLIDRVMLTIAMPDPFTVTDAGDALFNFVGSRYPGRSGEDTDLSASTTSQFAIGMALGRRLGPKGGAR